jgi:hypothetical protein
MICNNCQKHFSNKSNLNRHIKNICKDNIKIFKPIHNNPEMNNNKLEIESQNTPNNFFSFLKLEDLNQSELRYIIHQDNYIIRLTKLIYIDTPKYHNIYLTTDASYVYGHQGWEKMNLRLLCRDIVDHIMIILLDYIMINKDDINSECYKKVMKYWDKYSSTKNKIQICEKTRLLLINNKNQLKYSF